MMTSIIIFETKAKAMNFFCPKCGGKLAICFIESEKRNRKACQICSSIFYEHSKPCVGALVLKEDSVLLIQRAVEPFKGFWDIPGGFLELGEHPVDGIIRELKEETNLLIEPIKILDIFIDVYGSEEEPTLNICYICQVVRGEPKASSDAMDIRWFKIEYLPNNIAFGWAKMAFDLLRENYPLIKK